MKNTKLELKPTSASENLDYEAEVAEFIKRLNGDSREWILITQQYDFPFEANCHNTRESLIGDLADALACHYGIVAILHQQRRLTADEVKALELEAMGTLGPISRAKVEWKL